MKYIVYFLLILNLNLYANENENNSYWNKAVEQTDFLWNKTKQLTANTVEGAKNVTSSSVNVTKSMFSKGKKVFLEKTLLTSINLGLDYNNTIIVNELSIDDINGTLSLLVQLNGEDKELFVDVKYFDWDVMGDKKFIVLENLDVSLDIPWLDYLFHKYLKRNNGYVKVPYSLAKETFLKSLKENKKTTYVETTQFKEISKGENQEKLQKIKDILASNNEDKLVNIFQEFYDETYIKTNFINQTEIGLEAKFSLLGSKDDLKITITHFDWATANDKKLIVLGNVKFKDCTKPWIASLLEKHHEQVIFNYNDILSLILSKIKSKTQGSIENIETTEQ
ncbi:MAG: hypothetical protein PHF17_08260 [Arcobacteraceae bacterium]|jgi:hypothetical protein|nr:hypothetical protein [Arcobacteraceae bacterium]